MDFIYQVQLNAKRHIPITHNLTYIIVRVPVHLVWSHGIWKSVVPFPSPCSRLVQKENEEDPSEGESRGGGESCEVEGGGISDQTDSER